MLTESGFTFSKCIIATGQSDLRRGIDGLCASIRLRYNQNPLEKDTLFLFCGTKKDRLKGILWTGDRFVMLYIRLVEGRFHWPRNKDEARQINADEFLRLMQGYAIDSSIGPKHKAPPLPTSKELRKH